MKTSFLVFKNTGKPTKKVWFYEVENDGYSKGAQRKPQSDKNDLPDLLLKWPERKESEESWLVEVNKIKENDFILSANAYKPELTSGEENHRALKDILKEIDVLGSEMNKQRTKVSELLK